MTNSPEICNKKKLLSELLPMHQYCITYNYKMKNHMFYEQMEETYQDYHLLINRILKAIFRLQDIRLQNILLDHYLYDIPLDHIASRMNYSVKQIQRLHQYAIEDLKI